MSKTLIICDIQPEYSGWFSFDIKKFCQYLNRAKNHYNIHYFYNGYETLGMIDETELITWLLDNGLKEETLDKIKFTDKGYGFLREAMDNDVTDQKIIKTLQEMYASQIFDSRDLPENKNKVGENSIFWNESFDIIRQYSEVIFTGGSVDACLKELILGAKALKVKFELQESYLY